MKFVLIGAGQRGMIYAKYAHEMGHTITAVAETDDVKREIAGNMFGIPAEYRFASGAELLALPKLGDAAIIATMIPARRPILFRDRLSILAEPISTSLESARVVCLSVVWKPSCITRIRAVRRCSRFYPSWSRLCRGKPILLGFVKWSGPRLLHLGVVPQEDEAFRFALEGTEHLDDAVVEHRGLEIEEEHELEVLPDDRIALEL